MFDQAVLIYGQISVIILVKILLLVRQKLAVLYPIGLYRDFRCELVELVCGVSTGSTCSLYSLILRPTDTNIKRYIKLYKSPYFNPLITLIEGVFPFTVREVDNYNLHLRISFTT